MKIALLGYGRMGKTIDELALAAGHEVVLRSSRPAEDRAQLIQADVAIEFSRPEYALENIELCLQAGIPVVCGTTGWLTKGVTGNESFGPVQDWVNKHQSAFFYASNFSIGVNLFFKLNQYLAKMMADLPDYAAELREIHHIHKLDAPSGTAITLAEDLVSSHPKLSDWQLVEERWPKEQIDKDFKVAKRNENSLPIAAERAGETPGTHRITYRSEVDTIYIEHEAHGRTGFAKGALAAAEWLVGKQGVFGMKDLLQF
ncbi:4-hydroxy-tetrahydrodipicolinate reductase [Lewinellaceae bacterium SD302]|nr:4-hydroxy-tetrahydrodipicolinate reductase [Lewinellaceae bacterium SD302]